MRRVLLALLILILPTATALFVYLAVNKKTPTSRTSIGSVAIIAGAGYPAYAGVEDGAARSASFSDPFGVAVDRRGNIYVSDAGQSNRIRRITTEGKVETIAGSTEGFSDGDARKAQFNTPSGIALDKKGNIVIADTSNNRIRRLSSDGQVSTLAGTGAAGFKDGPSAEAEFDGPIGVAIDKQGNTIVADSYNDAIRRISADGTVNTIAGIGSPGSLDGNASIASFNTPSGVAVDSQGNIFVADTGNSAVRKITPMGEVTTIAVAPAVRHPVGIVMTHDDFLFVTDQSHVIAISPEGESRVYAGGAIGFADGVGSEARVRFPMGIAVDREGNLFIADSQNHLIREVSPKPPEPVNSEANGKNKEPFVQPPFEPLERNPNLVMPELSVSRLNVGASFPWPLAPQNHWHEVAGVVGEARGASGGVALDHIHSGLDVRGNQGEPVLSVLDEKVTLPVAAWDAGGGGEGIQIGLMSYIHTRVGRNERDEIQDSQKFRPVIDATGKTVAIRIRRGTRFKVGDFVGSINKMYHIHLNFGPRNSEANGLAFPFMEFKDTVAPTVEPNGIAVVSSSGQVFSERKNGRVVVSGDISIVVTAYDRVDGNLPTRKLGLYQIGYQLLDGNLTPVKGFEQPLMNIEFNRLSQNESVRLAYADGSGVSAYGTPTRFRYIVTNRVRDGEALPGLLRTSMLASGDYIIRVIAKDYTGNCATGLSTELPITVRN
jgi:sugar lactone lactonase YvrE